MIPEPAPGIQAQTLAALERQVAALASLSRRLDAAVDGWAAAAELREWEGPAAWCYSLAAGRLRSDLVAASDAVARALRETRRAVASLGSRV
jgi:hypothetical protein